MLGLSESELFFKIDMESAMPSSHTGTAIEAQENLEPCDMLIRLAESVAKAIEANNKAIEQQLRSAGKL